MEGQDHYKGRVVRLEVENFKSYKGASTIGPFKNFTTIIGPNGSGKSNLMDAISFVLGVRTMQLRGSLKELLYKNAGSDDPADRPRKGHVTLVYETSDGEEVQFTRAIHPSGEDAYASQYKIDGRNCTWEAYNTRLESYGILVKARNFLVFQGDIENVAQMSPKDLTNLFELISGSGALREEYDELEARMKETEASTSLIFSKKKAITVEKRLKKEQKAEAEKHMGLVRELEELKTRHFLWQAYHIEQDMTDARKDAATHKESLEVAEATHQAHEAEVEAKRKEHAGVAKERLLLEKQIKKKKAELEKKNPGLIKTREQISHANRRMKATEKDLENAKRKAKDHAAKIASLKDQLVNLEDVQQSLEEEIAAAQAERLELSPDLIQEYNRIKVELGTKTAKLEADRVALQTAQDADNESSRMQKDAAATVSSRIEDLEKGMATDQAWLEALEAKAEQVKSERAQQAAEKDRLVTERRRVEAKRAQLERKLDETEGTLREAKADNKQSRREQEASEVVEQLRSRFPQQVFGTVTQMADVPKSRYQLALSVVMGKDFDSVIVDTSETAIQCIQYVKEQRKPPMTFLPAETIRAKEVNPQLRTLGGSAKLALDCLAVKDARCARAFQAICGNTLVCDSVEEARLLAYGGEARHKVVALEGTAFMKTGLITGGVTAAMEERSKKWDRSAKEARDVVANLKDQYEKLRRELNELPTLREVTEKLQAAEAALSRLDNAAHYDATDVKSKKQKIKEYQDQIYALEKDRDARAPGLAALEKQMTERGRRIDALQRQINSIADKVFAEFSKRAGVKSIREYEEKHLKEAEAQTKKKMEVATQISRVKNQLEYEQKTDAKADVGKKEAEVKQLKQKLQDLGKEEEAHRKATEAGERELARLTERSGDLQGQAEGLDGEIKALKKAASQSEDEAAKCRREITAAQAKQERLTSELQYVLQAAARESVDLPMIYPSNNQGGKNRGNKRRRGAAPADQADDDEDLPELPDIDDEEESEGGDVAMEVDANGAGPSKPSKPAKGSRTKGRLDYGLLDEADMRRSGAERAARDKEMNRSMEDTSAQLARMAPNMKAMEQYEAVKEKEREQLEELEVARKNSKAAAEAFHAMRQRRYDLFMKAFNHVARCIDQIYKDLTKSEVHSVGGQAYLSLDSSDEPFLHGIKFSTMPPTKRFRDMEQLSGGEKTVAALALLFAIHSYQPSPFFVLDEVDAALDAVNVVKVANYMRHMTREGTAGNFQGIVISLKDIFYEKADALVGVCRDPHRGSSTTLTFDLTRFDPPTPNMA